MKLDALGALAGIAVGGADPSSLRRQDPEAAARAFEAFLLEQVVREMRRALPDGALGGGQAMELFGGLFDREVARRAAERDPLGLAAELAGAIARRGAEGAPEGRLPVDGARLTSRFGPRMDPIEGGLRVHLGVDLAAPEGSPVRAAWDGVVRFAGRKGGYGKTVIVEHADGRTTLYAHCSRLDVRPGERVRAGQVIAAVGRTGRATGPHLHFEVRRNGRPIDPARELGSLQAAARPSDEGRWRQP